MQMFSRFLFLVALLLPGYWLAQVIVQNKAYKAHFSNKLRQPTWVSYTLYKGGGDCDRTKFRFYNDQENLQTATDKDYAGSIYDKGHLANAEDFAGDCEKDELTFRYYNCLPQTANLNRGPWKSNEELVRSWSKKEKLYIICGGFFGSKKTGAMAVPDYCWKVVQSVKSKQVLFCGWFKNSTKATLEEIKVSELEKRLKSRIVLLK
jgi:endonuclease G